MFPWPSHRGAYPTAISSVDSISAPSRFGAHPPLVEKTAGGYRHYASGMASGAGGGGSPPAPPCPKFTKPSAQENNLPTPYRPHGYLSHRCTDVATSWRAAGINRTGAPDTALSSPLTSMKGGSPEALRSVETPRARASRTPRAQPGLGSCDRL